MISLIFILLGLIFGSFMAAYTYRYPRGIPINRGRSWCDNCKKEIYWYENIPLLSFLYLGGKCSHCKKKISIRYPIIETTTAILFFIIFSIQGLSLHALYIIIISLILEAIFIIDFEHQIIPDSFVFTGISITYFFYLISSLSPFVFLAAGFIAATFFVLIFILTSGRGMGLGDVKFALLGGMIVGINNLFVWIFTAFILGAFVGLMLIASKNAKLKDKIAFGPFLILAIPLTFILGQSVLKFMGY